MPTFYPAEGLICNSSAVGACISPHGTPPEQTWQLGASEADRVSARVAPVAVEYSLTSNQPTFVGVQFGGPSYRAVTTYSYGYTSGEWAPMVKLGFSAGYVVGFDVSASIGLNGVKGSFSLGGGTFGRVTGPFPRQQVEYGFGPSVSIGIGRQ